MRLLARIGLWGLAACIAAETHAQPTIYVNGTTGDDGWSGTCEVWDGGTCGPKRTIQAGIDAAGDTVVVADGVYTGAGNKNLDFGSEDITVRSANGPDNCIIDCEGDGRGFYFHCGETNDAVLDGLTIRNGAATHGGGIRVDGSSPTIARCIVEECEAYNGAGVYCRDSIATTLISCSIRNNTAYWDGGGVYRNGWGPSESNVSLTDCMFTGNAAGWNGGAVCVLGLCTVNIGGCTIIGNSAGGVAGDSGGGGVYLAGESTLTLEQSLFAENVAEAFGGGMFYFGRDEVQLERCRFANNQASNGGGLSFVRGGSHIGSTMANCTFDNNMARQYGGAIHSSEHDLSIVNCTLTGNDGEWSGGGLYTYNLDLEIHSCVFWNNWQSDVVHGGWITSSVTYSDSSGYDGHAGNIDADPRFVDADGPDDNPATWADNDYHLQASSPCIDTGDPAFSPTPGALDVDGQMRVWDGDGNGQSRVDMGVDEFGSFVYGDLNCDDAVNLFDIDPFVLVVTGTPPSYPEYYGVYPDCGILLADINADGSVDLFDIDPFVDLLTGGS